MVLNRRTNVWHKPLVWTLSLAPLLVLGWRAATDALGANPTEALVRGTGDWALRALCVALAVSPLRQALGWSALAPLRRVIGLFAFFWACVHLSSYALFDLGLDAAALVRDVLRRPFILVGGLAWLGLLTLALTSPRAVARWLGGVRWRALHRLVFAVAVLAVLHLAWMRAAKANWGDVWLYGSVLAGLLLWRLALWVKIRYSPDRINTVSY